MESPKHNLWTGGTWEQTSPDYQTPPTIPVHVLINEQNAHIADIRRKKTKKRAMWGFASVLSLIFLLTGSVALLGHFMPKMTAEPERPSVTWGNDDWPGLFPDSTEEPELDTEMEMPTIDSAETGTGVTVDIRPLEGDILTPQENYAKNLPSVVFIQTYGDEMIGTGTGVVLTEDGYIITNAHVVAGGYHAEVVLSDETVLDAELVGWSADEDLAVLKVDATGLTPVVFGDSDLLQVGDSAYAMGNPLGEEYRSTFTDGIISALDRYVNVDDVYMSLIQTTTPINFGNSGGALLNDRGQLVGITTIKIMSDDGTIESMGFAIPSVRVKQIADQLIAGEEILTPALGITVLQVSEPEHGLQVQDVNPVSDAAKKGLQVDDLIVEANGEPTRNTSDLARIKGKLMVGESLDLVILRDGEYIELSIIMENFQDVHENP